MAEYFAHFNDEDEQQLTSTSQISLVLLAKRGLWLLDPFSNVFRHFEQQSLRVLPMNTSNWRNFKGWSCP